MSACILFDTKDLQGMNIVEFLSCIKHDYTSAEARLSQANVLRKRAWYYRKQGNYTTAENMARQEMCDRAELLSQEHPDTLTNINNLTSIF